MQPPKVVHRLPQKRGFAAMSKEQHAQISSKGGQAVPAAKRTYARHPDIAAAAGRQARKNEAGGTAGD